RCTRSTAEWWTAACDSRCAAGVVRPGILRDAVFLCICRDRAVGPRRTQAEWRNVEAARAVATTDGRHSPGGDPGATRWAADHSIRGPANHRRISEDCKCDCG